MAVKAALIQFLAATHTDSRDGGVWDDGAIVAFFEPGLSTAKVVWEDRDKTLPSAAGKSQATLGTDGSVTLFGDGTYDIKIFDKSDVSLTSPLKTFPGINVAEPAGTVAALGVESVADLRALAASSTYTDKTNLTLQGYYAAGDGGGGPMYWDATSTETDDGGTIFKCTSITTGRWKRLNVEEVSIVDFGATSADAAAAVQAWITYLGANPNTGGYIPGGTWIINTKITHPAVSTRIRGDGKYKSVLKFTGSGRCIEDVVDSVKSGFSWSDFSVINDTANPNSNVDGVFLTGVQNSEFTRLKMQYFDRYGFAIDAGDSGAWWNTFAECFLWCDDIATSACVYLTSSGAQQCNAINFNSCSFHEQSNVASGALGIGVKADVKADTIVFDKCFFERLDYAAIVSGPLWKFMGCRFEKIEADTGNCIKVDDTLGATAGEKLRITSCSNSAGFIRVVDAAEAIFQPVKTDLPPKGITVDYVTSYSRSNGDGKDGIIENTTPADIELAYDVDELRSGNGPDGCFVSFTLSKCTVAGGSSGDVRVLLRGKDSVGANQNIGKDSAAGNLTFYDFYLPVGISTVTRISKFINFADIGGTVEKFVLEMTEPPAGVTVTLAGHAEISLVTAYLENSPAR